MCMTYYTVDDLRPGRPGWDVRQYSALAEAIDHYRTLPMNLSLIHISEPTRPY